MEELGLEREIKRRTEKTMRAKPPTLGQMKKMTQEAEQILQKTGTPKTSTTLFIAMMSVLTLTMSTKENHTYWAYIPNPPLNGLITWDDPSFPVYVNDSVWFPGPYDNRGPFKPDKEGKVIPEYSVGADGPPIFFEIGKHCVTLHSQAWIAEIPNGTVGEVNIVCQRWKTGLKQTLVSSLETPPLVTSSFVVHTKNPTDMEADGCK